MTNVPQNHRLVNEEFEAVQSGHLVSGSEWDGWSLPAIFNNLKTRMNLDAAATTTDQIMQNRIWAFKEGFARVADRLDVATAMVPVWELDLEPAYFEDEVRS